MRHRSRGFGDFYGDLLFLNLRFFLKTILVVLDRVFFKVSIEEFIVVDYLNFDEVCIQFITFKSLREGDFCARLVRIIGFSFTVCILGIFLNDCDPNRFIL